MKESIDLSIPVPCREKWGNLSPTDKGAYCFRCHKEVIDFTSWTENQIQDYFKNRYDDTCGRFRKDQLKTYRLGAVRSGYRFLPLSVVGITLLLAANKADAAATRMTGIQAISFAAASKQNATVQKDTLKIRTITGTVNAGDDQSPLPGVSVMLKGSDRSTVSDADGKFTIAIPDSSESNVLLFSFIGFESAEKTLTQSNELFVTLSPDTALLGEVVVVGGVCVKRWTPRAIWWRIKSIFW